MNIIPAIGSRSILAGKTGCGKTTLAQHLLNHYLQSGYPSIVCIDPKGTFKLSGQVITAPEEVNDFQQEQVLIYRPDWNNDEKEDVEAYDRLLRWIMLRGNTILYIDEAYALAPNNVTYPKYLRAIYTRGREFNITAIAATQRPVSIPRVMYTEVDHYYCFALQAESDRERMAESMGKKVVVPAKGYNFWYRTEEMDEAVYSCLNI